MDSMVQTLEDIVQHHGKQLESKISHEKEMEKKMEILIKDYKQCHMCKENKEISLQAKQQIEELKKQIQMYKEKQDALQTTVDQHGKEIEELKHVISNLSSQRISLHLLKVKHV